MSPLGIGVLVVREHGAFVPGGEAERYRKSPHPGGLTGIDGEIRIAGWATITVAVVGLVASLFITRAYCRYGCPTGAMLEFLRLGPAGAKFGRRDLVAAALALLAIGMTVWR